MGELKEQNYIYQPEGQETFKKRVILEIGCGKVPIFSKPDSILREPPLEKERVYNLLTSKENKSSTYYIGLDWNRGALGFAKRQARLRKINDQTFFVQADISEQLPFKDETINEILMIDVVGDPRFRRERNEILMIDVVGDSRFRRERFEKSRRIISLLLRQCYRVLDLEGELKIIEACSPSYKQTELMKIAKRVGFKFDRSDDVYNFDAQIYGVHRESSYALVFTKKKKSGA